MSLNFYLIEGTAGMLFIYGIFPFTFLIQLNVLAMKKKACAVPIYIDLCVLKLKEQNEDNKKLIVVK